MTPRSARSSSRSRYDKPYRRYQRRASMITSGGNRNPERADNEAVGGAARQRRRVIDRLSTAPCPASTQQCHAVHVRMRVTWARFTNGGQFRTAARPDDVGVETPSAVQIAVCDIILVMLRPRVMMRRLVMKRLRLGGPTDGMPLDRAAATVNHAGMNWCQVPIGKRSRSWWDSSISTPARRRTRPRRCS